MVKEKLGSGIWWGEMRRESFWAYEEARSKEVEFHPTPNLTIERSEGYRTVTQIPGRGHVLPVQESEERKIQGP